MFMYIAKLVQVLFASYNTDGKTKDRNLYLDTKVEMRLYR